MTDKKYPQGDAFTTLLLAAMDDAAINGDITQLQTQFVPKGKTELEVIRIIVVPEKMGQTWPSLAPLGTPFS